MTDATPAPEHRDATALAPLFVLAPARSNSTVVCAMIGMHPQLYGFPELALFRRATVAQLLDDPPGWRGAPARLRLAGLLRTLAQLHGGEQAPATVARALAWLEARASWPVEYVLDHLLASVAPRIGVEKSPENSSRDDCLQRLAAAYPAARFLHVTRHPLPTAASMHHHWSKLDYWQITPDAFHQFCLGVWHFQHRRIHQFLALLPAERRLQVRSEDVLNRPYETLPAICEWLGVDADPATTEALLHPERSVYARVGPHNAVGGGDSGFLRDPAPRETTLPESLELPAGWRVDPWLYVSVLELAGRLGYVHREPRA